MWMKITQNSAPGIGKAPLPGKTKDPQEPAIAGQLSFCRLDNRLIPRCDFLWNVYHFKLPSISAYQILFLDPSFALSERIQHGHHFFPWFLQIWWHAPPWVTLQFSLHIFDEPATFGPSTPLSSLSWPEHCTRAPKSNHVQNWYLNW